MKLNAPAGKNDSFFHNIRHKFRRRDIKYALHGTRDLHEQRIQGFRNLIWIDSDVFRQSGDELWANFPAWVPMAK